VRGASRAVRARSARTPRRGDRPRCCRAGRGPGSASSFDQHCSIGFMSGEYGGSKSDFAPAASSAPLPLRPRSSSSACSPSSFDGPGRDAVRIHALVRPSGAVACSRRSAARCACERSSPVRTAPSEGTRDQPSGIGLMARVKRAASPGTRPATS
jgi:hypothetical protein